MQLKFRELAKVISTRTLEIGYHQICVDLLTGECNNQALNQKPMTHADTNYTVHHLHQDSNSNINMVIQISKTNPLLQDLKISI